MGVRLARYKRQSFAAQHGAKRAYGSYEGCADPELEAVYISTPHGRHYEDTMLLRHGKHVLVNDDRKRAVAKEMADEAKTERTSAEAM